MRASPVVYAGSLLLSGAVLLTSAHALPAFHETQWYAGLSFVFLYLTLLAGPLRPTRRLASMEARRALGLSTCYFALLHSYFGFYRFVGGLDGLRYWSRYFAWSLFAGLLALVLLCPSRPAYSHQGVAAPLARSEKHITEFTLKVQLLRPI